MMTLLSRVILIAAALMSGSSEVQAYSTIGPQNSSCGTWTHARRNQQSILYEEWVFGFLSGVGSTNVDTGLNHLHGLDGGAVSAWIDSYCQVHPLEDIAAAAQAFVIAHPN